MLHSVEEIIENAKKNGVQKLDLSKLSLSIVPNSIVDIPGLTELNLQDNNIEDLSILNQMKSLEAIWLNNNRINSLSPLSGLPNLARLRAEDNDIKEIPAALNFPNLKFLSLSGNDVTPDSISSFPELAELELANCRISDLTFLDQKTKIINLDLSKNRLIKIEELINTPLCYELRIGQNRIEYIDPLKNLTLLKNLIANNNRISDIEPLTSLSQLEFLDLSQNSIDKLPQLNTLNSIKKLILDQNHIGDASNLKDLPSLTWLSLKMNFISETNFLERLQDLEVLDLSENQISRLDAMWNLTKLKDLNLGKNRIETVRPLKTWVDTIIEAHDDLSISLDISDNQIKSFKPLIPLVRAKIGICWDSNGKGINCQGNPWQEPPEEDLRKGRSAVLKNPIKVLAVHAQEDKDYYTEFNKRMGKLRFTFDIDVKSNSSEVGARIIEGAKDDILAADFVFLLTSADYFSDDECIKLNNFVESIKGKQVIPLPIRKCYDDEIFPFRLRPIIDWDEPISSSPDKDSKWEKIVTEIKQMFQKHQQNK